MYGKIIFQINQWKNSICFLEKFKKIVNFHEICVTITKGEAVAGYVNNRNIHFSWVFETKGVGKHHNVVSENGICNKLRVDKKMIALCAARHIHFLDCVPD